MLQGLLGCSSPGSRACCGCFDLLVRAVCATRLVNVDVVSGFSQVSSAQAKVTALLLFGHAMTMQTCWMFLFFSHAIWHTHINWWGKIKYSHSHRVRSASPLASAFGQILFFLWKWGHVWNNKVCYTCVEHVASESTDFFSLFSYQERFYWDKTKDRWQQAKKWKIVNFIKCPSCR